jgi:hypothetical protein
MSTDELIDYFEQAANAPDAHPDAEDIASELRLYQEAYESGVVTDATLKRHWLELTDRISEFDLDLILMEAGGFDENALIGYHPGRPLGGIELPDKKL